jgi:hypothetical protein
MSIHRHAPMLVSLRVSVARKLNVGSAAGASAGCERAGFLRSVIVRDGASDDAAFQPPGARRDAVEGPCASPTALRSTVATRRPRRTSCHHGAGKSALASSAKLRSSRTVKPCDAAQATTSSGSKPERNGSPTARTTRITAREALRHPWFAELRAAERKQRDAAKARKLLAGENSSGQDGADSVSGGAPGGPGGGGAGGGKASEDKEDDSANESKDAGSGNGGGGLAKGAGASFKEPP